VVTKVDGNNSVVLSNHVALAEVRVRADSGGPWQHGYSSSVEWGWASASGFRTVSTAMVWAGGWLGRGPEGEQAEEHIHATMLHCSWGLQALAPEALPMLDLSSPRFVPGRPLPAGPWPRIGFGLTARVRWPGSSGFPTFSCTCLIPPDQVAASLWGFGIWTQGF
jgi:hypothetical protein